MKISNILYTYEDKTRLWPRGNGCSVHILKGPLKTVMVDTGQMIGGFHRYLLAGMKKDGLDPAHIDEIWLTHPHIDHINAVPAVQKASGAAVYVHPSGRSFLTSPNRTFAGEMLAAAGEDIQLLFRFKPAVINGFINLLYGKKPVIPDAVPFQDGEIRDIGFPVQIRFTPGHSPDSVTFYVPRAKMLFTGDAFDLYHHARPTLNTPMSDFSDLYTSLEWMLGLEPRVLANGHKWTVTGGAECRRTLKKTLHFLDKIRAAALEVLEKGPAGLNRFVGHYSLKDQDHLPITARTAYWCVLKSLVREGVVARCPEYQDGKITRMRWRLA